MSLLRAYWSVGPLAVFAVLLLLIGAFTGDEFTAVGWGFFGAAIVRTVDIAQERARARIAALEARRRDLDETRRLLYTAVMMVRSASPELQATIVNALAHHGYEVDPGEAIRVLRQASTGSNDAQTDALLWLFGYIEKISRDLGDAPPGMVSWSEVLARRTPGASARTTDL